MIDVQGNEPTIGHKLAIGDAKTTLQKKKRKKLKKEMELAPKLFFFLMRIISWRETRSIVFYFIIEWSRIGLW